MGCGCRSGSKTLSQPTKIESVAPNLTAQAAPISSQVLATSATCKKCNQGTLQAVRPLSGQSYFKCPKCGSLFYRSDTR